MQAYSNTFSIAQLIYLRSFVSVCHQTKKCVCYHVYSCSAGFMVLRSTSGIYLASHNRMKFDSSAKGSTPAPCQLGLRLWHVDCQAASPLIRMCNCNSYSNWYSSIFVDLYSLMWIEWLWNNGFKGSYDTFDNYMIFTNELLYTK